MRDYHWKHLENAVAYLCITILFIFLAGLACEVYRAW